MVTEEAFTLEGLKHVEYIVVKVALKKDKTLSVKGLFAGYRALVGASIQIVNKSEMFIWLMRGDRIHILNADHWEITSIEIKKDGSNAIIHSVPGQAKCIARLKDIMKAMEACGMTESGGLIDITKYKGMPKSLQEELDAPEMMGRKSRIRTGSQDNHSCGAFHGAGSGYGGYYDQGQGYAGYTKPSSKPPETSEIKRTTKYPVTPALTRMKAKMEQIRQGTYKPAKLKGIPADKEEDDKESES